MTGVGTRLLIGLQPGLEVGRIIIFSWPLKCGSGPGGGGNYRPTCELTNGVGTKGGGEGGRRGYVRLRQEAELGEGRGRKRKRRGRRKRERQRLR